MRTSSRHRQEGRREHKRKKRLKNPLENRRRTWNPSNTFKLPLCVLSLESIHPQTSGPISEKKKEKKPPNFSPHAAGTHGRGAARITALR